MNQKTKDIKNTEQEIISNDNLPTALLQAKTYSHFITIPQTTIDYAELHEAIKNTEKVSYLLTKLEQHEDKGLHIHLVIKYTTQVRVSFIHKIIMKSNGTIGGLIDYDKLKNIHASILYLKKQETSIEGKPFMEWGEAPKENGTNQHKSKDIQNTELLLAIEKAQQGDTEGALEDIKNISPMDYLKFKGQINQTLKEENKQRKKYTAPSYSPKDVKLNKKQQEVWDLLQDTPKTRRIIWVSGDYGSGKSFLYNYIKANHEYGMYDAGQSASLDNVVYGYDEEGVIAWDLPRTFNFQDLGNSIAGVIEKFSDFGQSITSKKYSGKTQKVLGHVVVFSNQQPIEQLTHRDIIHVDLSTETEEKHVVQSVKSLILNPKTKQQLQMASKITLQQQQDSDSDPDDEYFSEAENIIRKAKRQTERRITNVDLDKRQKEVGLRQNP